jgi:hypothetical protein
MWTVSTSPPPAEMVAQLLKRARKRTWRPESLLRATGGGGTAVGAAAGFVLTAGLKLLVALRLVSFSI